MKLDSEEFMAKKNLDKSKKSLVEAMVYHEMYNGEACPKGDSKIVTANVRKPDSEAKKRE